MNPEGKIRRRDRKISSQNRKKKCYDGYVEKGFFFQSKKKLYIGLTQCPTGLDQIVHGQTGFLAQLDQKLLGLNHNPPKTVWVGLHPWAPNQLTLLITGAVEGSKEKLTTIYLENNPCVSFRYGMSV